MCLMRRVWIYLFSALYALVPSGVYHVEGVEVLTSPELQVVNGTNALLKCTFTSTSPPSEDRVSVSWSFQPLGKTTLESFFHYQGNAYPPSSGLFKDRIAWSGNVMKGDASITVKDVQPNFNGTYSCHVRNPPDIQGFAGEINLKVVNKVSVSEIAILAIAVGGSIGVVLVILLLYVFVRLYRRRQNDMEIEMEEQRSKDGVL